MIGKQKISIRTYIIAIFFLLGFFGIGGNSVFAAGFAGKCDATAKQYSSAISPGHQFTCESNTSDRNTACKTATNAQQCYTTAGDSCQAPSQCCICTKAADQLLGAGQGLVKTPTQPDVTTETKCNPESEVLKGNNCECKPNYTKNDEKRCVSCDTPGVCCGIKLNTNVPFVGKCIRLGTDPSSTDTTVVTEVTAFPVLMGALTKIMTTFILLICFGGILVGGVMVASSGGETARASEGKKLIGKVVMAIALLGASGIILHLINPNFFG